MASTEQSEEQAAARTGAAPVADPSAPASPAPPADSAVVPPDASGEPAPLPARRARRVVLATPPPATRRARSPARRRGARGDRGAATEPPAAVATPPRAPDAGLDPVRRPEKRASGRNGGAPVNGKAAVAAPPAAVAGGRRRVPGRGAGRHGGARLRERPPWTRRCPMKRRQPARGAVWRSRGLILGLLAVGLALYGQQLVWVDHAVIPSIHWYTLAIAVMLLAWVGTYKNKSFLRLPGRHGADAALAPPPAPARGARFAALRERGALILAGRYLLAFGALALNLFSVSQLRADYYSAVGGWAGCSAC